MRKISYFLLGLILILPSCNLKNDTSPVGSHEPTGDSSNIILSTTTNNIQVFDESFQAYDSSNNLLMSTNNIFSAIIKARDNSKSSNKCYVVDKNNNTVYKYSTSLFYYYRGNEYYGQTKNESTAIKWAKNFTDSYVINGSATEFIYVGKDIQTNNPSLDKDAVRGIENMSGSYGYVFSKKYSETSDKVGYSYIEYKVEFSKAKLKYFEDKSNEYGWNAYIFANIMCDNPWLNCDMGIMQIWESDKGRWQPVFNYGGTMYAPSNDTITEMKLNEETGYYEGADDLFFRCYVEENYYVLNITNLTNNVEYEYKCECNSLLEASSKSYILLAASNCPVGKSGGFWHPYCGNAFENIIFRDVKIAKFNNYENKEEFYNDSSAFSYALTMGADNASVEYGSDSYGKYIKIDMKNYQK